MQVIDSDGHLHEPFDLFERYMEKEFYPMRPRVVDLRDEQRDYRALVGRGAARASSSLHQRRGRRRLQISDAAPCPDESQG